MKSGGGGSGTRQRSPGAMARAAEGIDDSANVSFSTDAEESIGNVHPPTDDETVSILNYARALYSSAGCI